MANVENPYETNLSNNLVVTSHVDESTIVSLYKVQLIGYFNNGNITGTWPTKQMGFYNLDPNEQTIALSADQEIEGMIDITSSALEYPFTQYGDVKIFKGNTEISNYQDSIIKYLGEFSLDINNLTIEQNRLNYHEAYNESVNKLDSILGSSVSDINSIYIPFLFLIFLNKPLYIKYINDPSEIVEDDTNITGETKIIEFINLLEYDYGYKYIALVPKNSKTIAFSPENSIIFSQKYQKYVNDMNNLEISPENVKQIMDQTNDINEFIYQNTDDSYAKSIRLDPGNPNTDFNRECIQYPEGGDSAESSTLFSNYSENNCLSLHFQDPCGAIFQLTHPELEVPINFILECNTRYCFADDSVVETSKGQVLMKDLTMDDEVKCWDFDNGCVAYAKPLFISVKPEIGVSYEAVFDDGTICRYSAPHRCYCPTIGLFVSLSNKYAIGCKFYFQDGTYKKLVEWRRVNKPSKRYTMLTDYHMNSFVDGILAGSNYCNLYHINKDMKYDKVDRPVRENEFGVSDRLYKGLRLSEQFAPKKYITRWFDREGISKNL